MPAVIVTHILGGVEISSIRQNVGATEIAELEARLAREFGAESFARQRKGRISTAEFGAGASRVTLEIDYRQPAGAAA